LKAVLAANRIGRLPKQNTEWAHEQEAPLAEEIEVRRRCRDDEWALRIGDHNPPEGHGTDWHSNLPYPAD